MASLFRSDRTRFMVLRILLASDADRLLYHPHFLGGALRARDPLPARRRIVL